MRRTATLWLILAALPLAALLAGCANPADDKPEAVVGEAAELPSSEGAEGRLFVLAEGSTIGFVGSKVTGSHEGGFQRFDGEIALVDGDPTRSRVEVGIDTTSLWADNERLAGHLKSPDFFDVETYPTARFVSTQIVPAAEGYEVTGNLELHGVTKSITFPAAIEVRPDGVAATAEFFIQRFDFGIVYPGKPDDLIRDEVVIRLDLEAVPEQVS